MKNTIFSIALLSTIAFASAASSDILNVESVSKVNGNTVVKFERHFTDGTYEVSLGTVTKTFKGDISNEEIVNKGSLFADDYITVKYGTITKAGQTFALAKKRQDAFFSLSGVAAYWDELTRQIANEK